MEWRKAQIKIEFSIYGETRAATITKNWDGDATECDGIDQKVIDYLRDAHDKMYSEHREKEQYQRLKAKFDPKENN